MTNVFTAYIQKHLVSDMRKLDILDCNGGDHGQPLPPTSILRLIFAKSRLRRAIGKMENGSRRLPYRKNSHLTSLKSARAICILCITKSLRACRNIIPSLSARFWMTFGDAYLSHLDVLQNIGMTSIERLAIRARDCAAAIFESGAAQSR